MLLSGNLYPLIYRTKRGTYEFITTEIHLFVNPQELNVCSYAIL